ncbi:putative orotate phosphoribosyltransferase [Phaeomoniella chlamydospora]|uniref:Orotate phosphoribosyltransferase n=1 Tax=Phaeomoniella chlamydospora TaxID=158046 RepID=A0A0G2EPQ4_PHACM|nr:putative orotate phosphoribosyltransferase [Phaeomoniella chlamydospora]
MTSAADYRSSLVSQLISAKVLTFGEFTLKSGRKSPYFLNSSFLHTSQAVRSTAAAYAQVISTPPFTTSTGEPIFDVLFGPAYKGIPLCASTMTELAHTDKDHKMDRVSYSFNRKEAKDHGEGGTIVGCPLKGRNCLIIDDVITSGKAMREAVEIIQAQEGIVVGVVLLLDRQERLSEEEERSTVGIARETMGVPVKAILELKDLIEVFEAGSVPEVGPEEVKKLKEYRAKYAGKE